jgi:predicted RecB family endonuclease
MSLEVLTKAGTYADCLGDEYAIEVDPTSKWAEAIGQSLHYASELNRKPKIILFCEDTAAHCLADKLRLESTIAFHELPIIYEIIDRSDC